MLAKVTRIVGDDLIYLQSEMGCMVMTPDKIDSYRGERLKDIGIGVGTLFRVNLDARNLILNATCCPHSSTR